MISRQRAGCCIVSNLAPFPTVKAAAFSEAAVDWQKEGTDAMACTAGYAALELADHLRLLRRRKDVAIGISHAVDGKVDPAAHLGFRLGTLHDPAIFGPDIRAIQARNLTESGAFHVRACHHGKMRTILICGADRVGLLYGVYAYLTWLGFRWTHFSDRGVGLQYRGGLWDGALSLVETPHFRFRGFQCDHDYKGSRRLFRWMARNRLNFFRRHRDLWPMQKKLGLRLFSGGHLVETLLDPDRRMANGKTLFAAHPHWFSLCGGKRQPLAGRLCVSNQAAVRFVMEGLMEDLRKTAGEVDCYTLWPPDVWDDICQCPGCVRIGNGADRTLYLASLFRQRLDRTSFSGRSGKDILLHTCAYEGTASLDVPMHPLPKSFASRRVNIEYFPINRCYSHTLMDRRCREFNQRYGPGLRQWTKLGVPMIVGEYYNVSKYADLAIGFNQVMAEDIKAYARMGIIGLHYMHVPDADWGMRTLTQWQFARECWSPRDDATTLLREYLSYRYGPLAGTAQKAYIWLEEAMANINLLTSWLSASLRFRLPEVFKTSGTPRDMEALFLCDHFKRLIRERDRGCSGLGEGSLQGMRSRLQRCQSILGGMVKATADEDILWAIQDDLKLLQYTTDFVGLYDELSSVWHALKYGDKGHRAARGHLEKALRIAQSLGRRRLKGPGLPMPEKTRCLLNTGLEPLLTGLQSRMRPRL